MKKKKGNTLKKSIVSLLLVVFSLAVTAAMSVSAADFVSHTNECTSGNWTLQDGGTGYSKLHRYTKKATVTQHTTGGPCTMGGTAYIYYHYRDSNNQLIKTSAKKTLTKDLRTGCSFTANVPSSKSGLSTYGPDSSYAKVSLSTRNDTLKTD